MKRIIQEYSSFAFVLCTGTLGCYTNLNCYRGATAKLPVAASADFRKLGICCVQETNPDPKRIQCTLGLPWGKDRSLIEFPLGNKFSDYLRALISDKNRISNMDEIARHLRTKHGFTGIYLCVDGKQYSWAGNSLILWNSGGSGLMYRDSSNLMAYILRYMGQEELRQQKQKRKFRDMYEHILLGIEKEFGSKYPFRDDLAPKK